MSELKLNKTIAKNYLADINDIVPAKKALNELGYYDNPFGIGDYVDDRLFDGIENFQKDNGLQVDGVMRPKGETENKINEKLSRTRNYPGKTRTGLIAPINDFVNNFRDMQDSNIQGQDKYFHCKANYQAAKRGEYGSDVATVLSFAKEVYDLATGGNTLEESLKDLEADAVGWQGGKSGKTLFNSCRGTRPKGLSDKY